MNSVEKRREAPSRYAAPVSDSCCAGDLTDK
jgi:hypothetical protein